MSNIPNAIILLSGGLDSSVTAFYVKDKFKPKNIICLFFDYGQRTLKQEESSSRIICKLINGTFKKINISWLKEFNTSIINKDIKKTSNYTEKDLGNIKKTKQELENWWVPARNLIFISSALALAESEQIKKNIHYNIYTGFKSEGQIPMKDATPEFLSLMNKMVKHATLKENYKIIAPLINYDKDKIVELGTKLNVPMEKTFSCYISNKNNHCGKCEACILRKKAFYWANIKDKTIYLN